MGVYRIYLYCNCGHTGPATLPEWKHRNYILPRARCTVCGTLGAFHMVVDNGYRPKDGGKVEDRPCRR